MPRGPGSTYDSFVVRLWRERGSGRLLRAEVEHVQTGAVHIERGIASGWFLEILRGCLDGSPSPAVPDVAEDDSEKEEDDASDRKR